MSTRVEETISNSVYDLNKNDDLFQCHPNHGNSVPTGFFFNNNLNLHGCSSIAATEGDGDDDDNDDGGYDYAPAA
ncbi:hypothetical protein LIER_32814 [Lithospermum erythrorhizon]|uniref:Uncharacterized protein n=1 Tax=Lithospermum erythrorhizon TaxID=34254 RepID=A0AAV3RUW5_LITER